MSKIIIWFVKITGIIPNLLYLRRKTYYVDKKVQNRKLKEPAIIISNHTSLMDFPLYMFTFFRNTIRPLVAEITYNKNKALKYLKIASDNNLEVASKPDSEDICFIPDGNYKKFLEENSNIKPKQGNIVNSKGEILGKHTGLYNYTIGQRKGLGISHPTPLFVLGFDPSKNEVIVGEENEIFSKVLI